ncbi:MAG: adenylate/guanylate cyclase domain-containing protein, partial [Thermomicrobiales bacterium]
MGEAIDQRAFLFTDIEGSTRLWERCPQAMARAIDRHNALIAMAVGDQGGRVFKTMGDAVCAVFPRVDSALLAAVAAQRSLVACDWSAAGLEVPLMVRMAVHAGDVATLGDDFAGQVLNRVSRLLAAGHGGQILIAGSASAALEHPLPDAIELRSLGERRLRDVPGYEHILQIVVPDLPAAFPPLRTLDPIAHNLPVAPYPCLGREVERQHIRTYLTRLDSRLVTLIGPGGIGKTRLALQAGSDLVDEFRDGVWFVDLSAVRDDAQVTGSVMRVLGVREEPGTPAAGTLCAWLGSRRLLLVLDNCEQVVQGSAELAAQILGAAPGVRVLATSRIALEIRGEQRLPVAPLDLPEITKKPDVERIAESASVRLFVDRAMGVEPTFSLDTRNAPHVAEICRRVDGIPLALELAAARITILSPEELQAQLERRLPALTGGPRDLPDRHKTLHDAIAWSYDLLSQEEQSVFARLSVFAGGWTIEAANEVLGSDPTAVLESLATKSLIRSDQASDGATRYSMLETIREFASERAADQNDILVFQARHAQWVKRFSEEIGPFLLGGDRQVTAFDEVTLEYANIVSGLTWFADQNDGDAVLRSAVAIWNYWTMRGPTMDGKVWIERALALSDGTGPDRHIDALNKLGNISVDLELLSDALIFYRKSLRMAMSARYRMMIGRNLCCLGMVANMIGGSSDELRLLQRALKISREIGDHRGEALTTLNLGISFRDASDLETSTKYHLQAIGLLEKLGDINGVARARNYYGLLLADLGQIEVASDQFRQASTVFDQFFDEAG